MPYNKPELALLGSAVDVIHGTHKRCEISTDGQQLSFTVVTAYEVDE